MMPTGDEWRKEHILIGHRHLYIYEWMWLLVVAVKYRGFDVVSL
jgi:hypothetical protein